MTCRADELRASLLVLADRTQGQLQDLHKNTTEERADIAARGAYEVYTVLRQLASELQREGRQVAA